MCDRIVPNGCFWNSIFEVKSLDCLEVFLVSLNKEIKEFDVTETLSETLNVLIQVEKLKAWTVWK